jgi:hypothetical protein
MNKHNIARWIAAIIAAIVIWPLVLAVVLNVILLVLGPGLIGLLAYVIKKKSEEDKL